MKQLIPFGIAGFLAAAAVAVPSFAVSSPAPKAEDHEQARDALRRGDVLPLLRILPIVQKRFPGDIIKIKLDEDNDTGHIEYDVKVLTASGRVIEVEVDAKTGQILEVEED